MLCELGWDRSSCCYCFGDLRCGDQHNFESKGDALASTAIENIYSHHDLPKVKCAPELWGGGKMAISHPREVLEIMKSVPIGKLVTLDEIWQVLANDHQSDTACPMTTGMFVSLEAKAHVELIVAAAYWRTLKRKVS